MRDKEFWNRTVIIPLHGRPKGDGKTTLKMDHSREINCGYVN
jgi:hypothetical protein